MAPRVHVNIELECKAYPQSHFAICVLIHEPYGLMLDILKSNKVYDL